MTAEQLSAWANVPLGLAELVFREALESNIDVPTVRSDMKCRDFVKVRRDISLKAREQSFSYPQIGRALNRDHTSVRYLAVTA